MNKKIVKAQLSMNLFRFVYITNSFMSWIYRILFVYQWNDSKYSILSVGSVGKMISAKKNIRNIQYQLCALIVDIWRYYEVLMVNFQTSSHCIQFARQNIFSMEVIFLYYLTKMI